MKGKLVIYEPYFSLGILLLLCTFRPVIESKPLKIFIICARSDEPYEQQLLLHLGPIAKSQKLNVWHDGNVEPGDDWEKSAIKNLKTSDLVLILVSVHSLNSEFIQKIQLPAMLERLNAGHTRLVPIIVSPCAWKFDPVIQRLQALPLADTEGVRSVSEWKNADQAWTSVVEQIGNMVSKIKKNTPNLLPQKSEEKKIKTAQFDGTLFRSKLDAYWASFFNLICWNFEYLPFENQDWAPNFKIETSAGNYFLVDVGLRKDFTKEKRYLIGKSSSFSNNILALFEDPPFGDINMPNMIGLTSTPTGFEEQEKDFEFHSSVVCNTFGQGNDIYNLGLSLEEFGDIFHDAKEFCLPLWKSAKNAINY